MRHEALAAIALSACWRGAPSASTPSPPVHVVSTPAAYRPPPRDQRPQPEEAAVGYGNGSRFQPSTQIPLAVGVHYLWRIRLPCTSPVPFRETLVLPAPTTWTISDPSIEISADKSIATTHKDAACIDGWIENGWYVNGDDPPGEYEITVEIAGYATQHFRVVFY
jgi:hypothetical protein